MGTTWNINATMHFGKDIGKEKEEENRNHNNIERYIID